MNCCLDYCNNGWTIKYQVTFNKSSLHLYSRVLKGSLKIAAFLIIKAGVLGQIGLALRINAFGNARSPCNPSDMRQRGVNEDL